MTVRREVLPDGSLCLVKPSGVRASLISREVEVAGESVCVWGQVFASGEDHAAQVEDVVEGMRRDPASYQQWWIVIEGDTVRYVWNASDLVDKPVQGGVL